MNDFVQEGKVLADHSVEVVVKPVKRYAEFLWISEELMRDKFAFECARNGLLHRTDQEVLTKYGMHRLKDREVVFKEIPAHLLDSQEDAERKACGLHKFYLVASYA